MLKTILLFIVSSVLLTASDPQLRVTGKVTGFADFPEKKYIPAAGCTAPSTSGVGWSLPATSAAVATCHVGNVVDGVLAFADAQSAQFNYLLPDDWDSVSSVDLKLFVTDSSTTGTVIFQAASSCTTVNGTEVDDQTFNTAQSFGTLTMGSPASAGRVASLNGLTKTGCSAGSMLHVKISRTTDTAAGAANVSGAQITARRTY